MIQQKDKVKYGTTTIPYCIIRTRRIKTSELIIDADTITVRTPYDKDKREIQKIVLDKASWILKKQKECRETTPEIVKPSFKPTTILPYLGRNYSIEIRKNQPGNSVEIIDGKFLIQTKAGKLSNSAIPRLYENFLMEKAQDIFGERVKKYLKSLGVTAKRIAIKSLRNRWGSITKNGVLNLNLNVLKAPEHVIDYIILHELCHLKIKEHSHHYWNLLHRFMPNYQDKIEWLKVNGSSLL